MTIDTALCSILIPDAAGGEAPDWVQLFPAGPELPARDGRFWRMDDPAAIVARFTAAGRPLPVDWEHATEIRGPQGLPAPAAGWITELEVRDGAIWGRIQWTEAGAATVAAREYRFISPTFYHRKVDAVVTELTGAGITNKPALTMQAMARADADPEPEPDMENPMTLSAIALAHGLPETATEAEIVAAARKARADAEAPDMARFAPRAELTEAMARASSAEAKLAELQDAAETAAVEAAVDAQIEAGRIAPAGRDFYVAACRAQGVAAFEAAAAALPNVGAQQKRKEDPAAPAAGGGSGAHGLDENELAMCKATGRAPEAYAKLKAAEAAAS